MIAQDSLVDKSHGNTLTSLITFVFVQVLDPKERPIRTLTPEKEGTSFIQGDPTAQVIEPSQYISVFRNFFFTLSALFPLYS